VVSRRIPRYSDRITRSRRWKALRWQVLRRDGFACVSCGARGRLEVDHIEPVRSRPDLAWDLSNLQSLCPACHTRKTRLECGHDPIAPERAAWREVIRALEK
jgi:5-methylcytosine-specific restriction enzyme A